MVEINDVLEAQVIPHDQDSEVEGSRLAAAAKEETRIRLIVVTPRGHSKAVPAMSNLQVSCGLLMTRPINSC